MQEDWGTQGKTVHHQCGYLLQVRVLHQFEVLPDGVVVSQEGKGDVVVEYRDNGFVVWMCPKCCSELRMWWDSNGRWVGPQEQQWSRSNDVACVEQVSEGGWAYDFECRDFGDRSQ